MSGDNAALAMILGFGAIAILLLIVIVIIGIISMWRIYSKHYEVPGVIAIIPFYNTWVMSEKTFGEGWYGLLMYIPSILNIVLPDEGFLGIVQGIIGLIAFIYSIYFTIKAFKQLNVGVGMVILTYILPFIGLPIIAFGSNTEYLGTTEHIF